MECRSYFPNLSGDSMNLREIIGLALKASIMLTVFGFGLQATREDVLYLVRRPRLLAASLASMFVLMPLFALFLTSAVSFVPAVTIAIIAFAISPVPPLIPKKVVKSGGLGEYGLGLMVTAAVFSVGSVPLATCLIGKYFNRPFAMGPGAVAKLIVLSVLIPLVVGMICRKVWPRTAGHIASTLIRVAGIVLLIGVLFILVFAFPTIWSLVGNGTIIAFIAFGIVGLMIGHLLGGPDRDDRVTLALSTACRHPAIALAIATANVPQEHHVFSAILLYLVVNALLTIPYVAWQRNKARGIPANYMAS